jgi:hypothetical protein
MCPNGAIIIIIMTMTVVDHKISRLLDKWGTLHHPMTRSLPAGTVDCPKPGAGRALSWLGCCCSLAIQGRRFFKIVKTTNQYNMLIH